jgi:hypothetical protein
VVAAAAELGEFNVAIAGMKGAKGHAPKSWAPDGFPPEKSSSQESD